MNQPITKPDIQRVMQIQQSNEAMLITMHTALIEILSCNHALDSGVTMRYIAEKSLSRVAEIADSLEVANGQI